MIYVIEYNYPSQLLVEHINNYLEKAGPQSTSEARL